MKTKLPFGGAFASALLVAGAAHAQVSITGPSTASTPYAVGLNPAVKVYSVATVDNTGAAADDTFTRIGGGSYSMVGIADGLGALDNNNGTFSIFMNHELVNTAGATRDHGSTGSFVSKWNINTNTLAVVSAGDLIQNVNLWNGTGYTTYNAGNPIPNVANAISRLCSADLPEVSAFSYGGLGTTERIFMNGEEKGAEGRAFAHILTGTNAGTSYELPYLGKFSWENSMASPFAQNKTIVMGTDDTTPGQVYMYVGTKTSSGSEIERAGLTNGVLYGVVANGLASEDRTTGVGGASVAFTMTNLGDVSAKTGATLQAESVTAGITQFLRPEDGAWDTQSNNKFYFVTTDRVDEIKAGVDSGDAGTAVDQIGRSRLWSMTFSDIANPENGGTIQMLLDGTEAGQMFDNMTVDSVGNVILQEDVGGYAHNGKVWSYNPATDALTLLIQHDAARFGEIQTGSAVLAATSPYTNDEEFSGVIDITSIMQGSSLYDANTANRWYAMVDQAHYSTGISAAQVEGGQLLIFSTPEPSRGVLMLLGLGALVARRRRK
ncbi:MAG: alkaline phosphatase PhoX [Roseimicrobium sp.]